MVLFGCFAVATETHTPAVFYKRGDVKVIVNLGRES